MSVVPTFIVWKVILHRAHWQLLLEPVDLVQEQDDAGLNEPPRIADAVEKCKSFLHTIHGLIFEQQLVVFGNGDKEQYGGDILETVDPLLSFRSLSTNIEHSVGQVLDDEGRLGDAGSLDTGAQDILIIRHVIVRGDAVDRVKVAVVVSNCGLRRLEGNAYYRAESFN